MNAFRENITFRIFLLVGVMTVASIGYRAFVMPPLDDSSSRLSSIRLDSQIRPIRSDTDVREMLEAVLIEQANAWNDGDIDTFMDHYWKSEELTFSSGGKITRGWQTTKENYKRRYPSRERMGQLSFSSIEVTALNQDAALVLGRWNLQRDSDPVGGNFSLVFRLIDGAWVIVHDHTSQQKEATAESLNDLPQATPTER